MAAESFAYLRGLIPLLFLEYVLLLIAFGCGSNFSLWCSSCCWKDAKTYPPLRFEDAFESYSPAMSYVLLITRFLSFGYILGVGVIASYIKNNGYIWFYFTFWNLELLSVFYLLAMSCSILGIWTRDSDTIRLPRKYDVEEASISSVKSISWSADIVRLGFATQVFFEVCGGTAIFITVVAFIFLDRSFSFWNVTHHFITTMSLLLEMSLNRIPVRLDHFAYNISWSMLYLIFIWPLVVLGNIKSWPYFFLAVDTPSCYAWYTGFVVAIVVFYLIFYGLSSAIFLLKDRFTRKNAPVGEANTHLNIVTGVAHAS
jgi:hypothetical protein